MIQRTWLRFPPRRSLLGLLDRKEWEVQEVTFPLLAENEAYNTLQQCFVNAVARETSF